MTEETENPELPTIEPQIALAALKFLSRIQLTPNEIETLMEVQRQISQFLDENK